MTFQEFKSWLDGFIEGINGAPNAEQWERIKRVMDKVCEPAPVIPFHPNITPTIAPAIAPVVPIWRAPYEPLPWPGSQITCTGNSTVTCNENLPLNFQ
jgi:hypothetical protein